jgi:hypothetical protein
MDAVVTWEFWAAVLVGGLVLLGVLVRWAMMGDGRLEHPSPRFSHLPASDNRRTLQHASQRTLRRPSPINVR